MEIKWKYEKKKDLILQLNEKKQRDKEKVKAEQEIKETLNTVKLVIYETRFSYSFDTIHWCSWWGW